MNRGIKTSVSQAVSSLLFGFAVLATAAPGHAQSLDYDTLEQVFREPVTASATGKPQRASDAPANIEIITQDEIQRSGATDIPGVLQYVAGVDVRRYGIAAVEVGIRGYNQPYNPRLLVMVNGRQVYSDDYGHVAWPTIPVQLAEIRQIEVIKGPNSALYGFNAVSGVINIITYDPLRDKVNTATFSGGTQGYLAGSAVATGQIGDQAGLRISVGGFKANDFQPGNLTPIDVASRQAPKVGAFNVDTRWRFAPEAEVFVEASMADGRYAEETFVGGFYTQFFRTNSLRVGVNADTTIGLINISAYRNEQLLSFSNASPLGNDWVNGDVYVLQASDTAKLGTDHTIRIGGEYRNNAATSSAFFQGTIGYEVLAANAMWNWQLAPSLSLTNAVRIDYLRLRYSGTPAAGSGFTLADYNHASLAVPSFNSGLVFRLTDVDTMRLMVAHGVQLPSLVDFGLQFPFGAVGPVVVAGNPNVNPSTVDNIELDYDRELPIIGSTLRGAIFVQRNKDLIIDPVGSSPVFSRSGLPVFLAGNVGSSDAAGAEIGVKGHSSSGFRWNTSYALVATTNETRVNKGPVATTPIDYAHAVPQHVLIAGVGYAAEKVQLDLMARWQSSYRDFQSNGAGLFLRPVTVSNYFSLSARAAYALTDNLKFIVAAQQINVPNVRTAGPLLERRVIASITARF